MCGAPLRAAVSRALDHPALFYAVRFLLVGPQRPLRTRLRSHLAAVPGERVLDVCCGIGEFADTVDGDYLGVDLNPRFIEGARRRFGRSPSKQFEVADATRLDFPDRHFDKAMAINCLHHFSDDVAVRVLREVRRVTRRLVVIVDADGTPRGLMRRALVALDRGRFMRSPERLSALVGQALPIAERVRFGAGLYTELLFHCPL